MGIINSDGYIKSENIKVFPCSYRGYKTSTGTEICINPEARLSTEYNLTHTGNNLVNSYLISISIDKTTTECVIGGYYFKITGLDADDINTLAGKYLCIKTKPVNIITGEETKILDSWAASTDNFLDKEVSNINYFTGLIIKDNTTNATASLKIYNLDKSINNSVFLPNIKTGTYRDDIVISGDLSLAQNLITEGNFTQKGTADIGTQGGNVNLSKSGYTTTISGDLSQSGIVSLGINAEDTSGASGRTAILLGNANNTATTEIRGNLKNNYLVDLGTTTADKTGTDARSAIKIGRAANSQVPANTTEVLGNFKANDLVDLGADADDTADRFAVKIGKSGQTTEVLGKLTIDNETIASYDSLEGLGAIIAKGGIFTKKNIFQIGNSATNRFDAQTTINNNLTVNGTVAEGQSTAATGTYSHAEGQYTGASGNYSHAEGSNTAAFGNYAHAEGQSSITLLTVSSITTNELIMSSSTHGIVTGDKLRHTENGNYKYYSVSSVSGTTVYLSTSPAISDTYNWFKQTGIAYGTASHTEGFNTVAFGDYSHAEGFNTRTGKTQTSGSFGYYAHAEGQYTVASGLASHSEGWYTEARKAYQHVFGSYNLLTESETDPGTKGTYIEIVGNGTSESNRSNARTLDWDGNETVSGDFIACGIHDVSSYIHTLQLGSTTSDDSGQIELYGLNSTGTGNEIKFKVDSSGNVTATTYTATSDLRKKENIIDYTPEKSILDLPIKKFDFISGPKNQIGCIAQDLQKICPEIVNETEEGYLSIQESKIVYLLLNEVKKLSEEINKLKRGS